MLVRADYIRQGPLALPRGHWELLKLLCTVVPVCRYILIGTFAGPLKQKVLKIKFDLKQYYVQGIALAFLFGLG